MPQNLWFCRLTLTGDGMKTPALWSTLQLPQMVPIITDDGGTVQPFRVTNDVCSIQAANTEETKYYLLRTAMP